MAAPYDRWQDGKSGELARVASILAHAPTRLSPLVMMSDPDRLPDPLAALQRLPPGGAFIYRHFGADNRADVAKALREDTHTRGQQLLIANDPALVEQVGADGLHCPRDARFVMAHEWAAAHPEKLLTSAGLKSGDYTAAFPRLDALFVSAVFPSRSPSAGRPVGVKQLADHAARLPVPVYALGGVTRETAAELIGSGASGLAAINGFGEPRMDIRPSLDIRKENTAYGHRFVIDTDHGEAEMTMKHIREGVFNANHTFVPKALEGQGIAGKIFDAMAADAIAHSYKVIPGCPYVAVKFKRKPKIAAQIEA